MAGRAGCDRYCPGVITPGGLRRWSWGEATAFIGHHQWTLRTINVRLEFAHAACAGPRVAISEEPAPLASPFLYQQEQRVQLSQKNRKHCETAREPV